MLRTSLTLLLSSLALADGTLIDNGIPEGTGGRFTFGDFAVRTFPGVGPVTTWRRSDQVGTDVIHEAFVLLDTGAGVVAPSAMPVQESGSAVSLAATLDTPAGPVAFTARWYVPPGMTLVYASYQLDGADLSGMRLFEYDDLDIRTPDDDTLAAVNSFADNNFTLVQQDADNPLPSVRRSAPVGLTGVGADVFDLLRARLLAGGVDLPRDESALRATTGDLTSAFEFELGGTHARVRSVLGATTVAHIPAETCNGRDDDFDGLVDNDCVPPDAGPDVRADAAVPADARVPVDAGADAAPRDARATPDASPPDAPAPRPGGGGCGCAVGAPGSPIAPGILSAMCAAVALALAGLVRRARAVAAAVRSARVAVGATVARAAAERRVRLRRREARQRERQRDQQRAHHRSSQNSTADVAAAAPPAIRKPSARD